MAVSLVISVKTVGGMKMSDEPNQIEVLEKMRYHVKSLYDLIEDLRPVGKAFGYRLFMSLECPNNLIERKIWEEKERMK